MRRIVVFTAIFQLLIGMLVPLSASASTSATPDSGDETSQATSPEQQLANKFVPIVNLRKQTHPCDREGEGYYPTIVETILGNPDVALKHHETGSSKTDPIITMAPTAQDLAGKGETYYLDTPGDPRRPGCTFETDFKQLAAEHNLPPSTYAHIVVDEEKNRVVLQYWLWYYFNDWNNTHQSDWEMVEIVFNANSVEEALTLEPIGTGFAQHDGGETANWDDDKLHKDGNHVEVYPTAGSHASHYDQSIFIGWGENGTGVGCDDSSSPSERRKLTAILIPDEIEPDGPFAWLLFEGRWGQRQEWQYNGPTGPNMKPRWEDPVTELEDWRESSLKVSTSNASPGLSATDIFCGVTKFGSRLLMRIGMNAPLLGAIGASFAVVLLGFLFLQRHDLFAAITIYRHHIRTFISIGLITLPIGIVFNLLWLFFSDRQPLKWILDWMDDSGGAHLVMSLATSGVQQTVMVLLLAPPVIVAVLEIRKGERPKPLRCLQMAYDRFWIFASALLLATVVVQPLLYVVIGLPIAFFLAVRWQFIGQSVIVGGAKTGRDSLRTSQAAVKGHWWHVVADTLLFQLIAIIPGPIVGLILMLLGKASVDFVNTFSGIVYAITVPISVIGLTLVYIRYQSQEASGVANALRAAEK